MKINELDENITNWLARKGFLGTDRGLKATGEYLAKQSQAATAASMNLEKQQFKQKLLIGIKSAVESGLVNTGLPESIEYGDFDRLIENTILNEAAINMKTFVYNYMINLLKNYSLTADQLTQLKLLTDQFANYHPSKPLPNAADQLYALVYIITSQYDKNQVPLPVLDSSVSTSRGIYKFSVNDKKWTKVAERDPYTKKVTKLPTPEEITNINQINQLNKQADAV